MKVEERLLLLTQMHYITFRIYAAHLALPELNSTEQQQQRRQEHVNVVKQAIMPLDVTLSDVYLGKLHCYTVFF
jgi:hypothetical protein